MERSQDALLSATGLVKSLGGKRVVDGIDLACRAGEVLGLLGPNGAGKTTALRMCYGFLRPDEGQIFIAGHDLARDKSRAPESAAGGDRESTVQHQAPASVLSETSVVNSPIQISSGLTHAG